MRAAAVLALVLAGCAQPSACAPAHRVAVRVDRTVVGDGERGAGTSAADYQAELVAGAARWAALGGVLALDDRADMVVQCATWGMDDSAATANEAGIAVDCLYLYGLTPEGRLALFAHEVGHLLGLDHVPDPAATMYYEANGAPDLTADDVAEYRRANPPPGETP